MVKKNNRVTRNLFTSIVKNGVSLQSPHFSFRVKKIRTQEVRVSFVVSKKVAGKAAERNKLKRRGYYIIRTLLSDFTQPFHGIFFVKKGAKTAPYETYKMEIISLLKQAKLL